MLFLHRITRRRFASAGIAAAVMASVMASPANANAAPSAQEILVRLKPGHPRLLVNATGFEALRAAVNGGGQAAAWAASLRKSADNLLNDPVSRYEIPDGKRLLATSRRVLTRTLTLGLAFRLANDRKHANRLWAELDAAASFKDWNPSHFLDTAEMTAAFAIGYDWLYDAWSPEQRQRLRNAITEMGLKPSLTLYRRHKGWSTARHNWNQVCNGGMTLGALAIAEDDADLSGEILAAAVASVPAAMREFGPDGAWGEGPGYWDYAVMYNVFMLAALESSLGTDFDLAAIAGFDRTAAFPVHMTGPTGKAFNYADAGEGAPGGPHVLWLARRFRLPDIAAWRLAKIGSHPEPLDFVWGASWLKESPARSRPANAVYFRNAEVVSMRTSWDDPQATFIGFKAGDNRVNHGHLDTGSFVLDALGKRWASDPGSDDYNLPGYFGKQRWDYYRLRAEGHNTLVIGPDSRPDQDPAAQTKIVRFSDRDGQAFAIADLTPAYARTARSVQRGIRQAGRSVLIEDEVETLSPTGVWWFMHTEAAIRINGSKAQLTQGSQSITAEILAPLGAIFQDIAAEPLPASPRPEGQGLKHARAMRKLAVFLPDVTAVRIAIRLTPGSTPPPVIPIQPLKTWK